MTVFTFLHPGRCTYCTCYVRASTTTRVRLYIDQYVRTRSRPECQRYIRFDQVGPDCQALPCVRRCSWWVPAVWGNRFFARTHFLACEGVAGGSQQSEGRIIFFARTHFLACEDVAGGSHLFFAKYGGPSDGSPLSGGGIIIVHVIRRHFLAAAVDPAVSLSTYSPGPMEVVP